jgi:hypothetical protein
VCVLAGDVVPVTAADPLPRLRDLVDHVRVQQPGPGVPLPGLQAGDEAPGELSAGGQVGFTDGPVVQMAPISPSLAPHSWYLKFLISV